MEKLWEINDGYSCGIKTTCEKCISNEVARKVVSGCWGLACNWCGNLSNEYWLIVELSLMCYWKLFWSLIDAGIMQLLAYLVEIIFPWKFFNWKYSLKVFSLSFFIWHYFMPSWCHPSVCSRFHASTRPLRDFGF